MSGTDSASTSVVFDDAARLAAEEVWPILQQPRTRLTLEGRRDHEGLPDELATVLSRVIEVMARGGSITVASMPDELTTSVAARQLGISRPTLMRMIRDGEIEAHMVGTHHRVKTQEVMRVRAARLEKQRQAFEELRSLDEEFGG